MNPIRPLYLTLTKKRFAKPFAPLAAARKSNYLISVPRNFVLFLKSLDFLSGLSQRGEIVLLLQKNLDKVYHLLKPHIFKAIFYEEELQIFSKNFNAIKKRLSKRTFDYLIELNSPANVSLCYLVQAEKRICLCEKNNFPYYNILIKDGLKTLNEFFCIKDSKPQNLFQFRAHVLKNLEIRLNKSRPLLFVNAPQSKKMTWDGDMVILGEDIHASKVEAYQALYLADAYYGEKDKFYALAKIFNKKIIE